MTDADELLPVVDENDRVIRTQRREEIHQQGLLHRAVHILVFDNKGRIYLQKRSQGKDAYPGKWTSSASGHVDPGESYLQAARRELKEELGLTLDLEHLGRIQAGPVTDNEFTEVYKALTAADPQPNPQEISRGDFFSWDQALALAGDAGRAAPSLGAVLKIMR